MSENYLSKLSPAQREAAQNIEGASLIIAGAGSGKTRTLTYRLAHMIDSGIAPHNILALTFTNKAAREMKERIGEVMPYHKLRGLWMGTFHAVFRRILSAEASVLGYPENFTIYETADSKNLIKSIVREFQLPEDRYKPGDVFARISLAKNSLVTPQAYESNSGARAEDEAAKRPDIYRIYARYVQRCKANGAMDFDDMLLQMNYLLRDHPEIAAKYADQFRYIMVDEYQDTNYSQYLIVKKLAAAHGNICVVGDDSQSIYSFRGARIDNILRFERDFDGARTYKLEQNYRSTQTIVDASNSLIEHNTGKLQKELYSENEKGDLIRVVECYTDKDEAARVANDIFSVMYNKGAEPSDFAILYRTNAQSRVFEEQLRNKNIPYRIYGGRSFYDRAEIKDMLCYLRLAVNPADDEALKRIINVPARGIGDTSLNRIEGTAVARGVSMFEVLRTMNPAEIGIRGTAVRGIASFVEAFAEFATQAPTQDAYEFASAVASKSGLLAFYRQSNAIEDKTRLENIEELLNSIKSFEKPAEMGISEDFELIGGEIENDTDNGEESQKGITIGDWLSEVALLSDQDEEADNEPKVTLLTVHSSKGLEFKYVYVVGMEEKLFPSMRLESSDSEIEEERRLFYVALTRAQKRATLSYALTRFKWGDVVDCLPSRFIKEIDQRYLDIELSAASADEVEDYSTSRPSGYGASRGGFGARGGYGVKPRFGVKKQGNDPHNTQYLKRSSVPQQSTPKQGSDRDFINSAMRTVTPPPSNLRKVGVTASSTIEKVSEAGELKVGTKVRHERFGVGEIVEMEKTATDVKLTVNFGTSGTKTLLEKFAKLTIIA